MSNKIISQLTRKFEAELSKAFESLDFTNLVNNLDGFKTKVLGASLGYVSGILNAMDIEIANSEARRKNGFLVQKRDVERTITTPLGDLTYKRSYYKEKTTGQHCYLLDQIIGVESYERISKETIAMVIENACEMSYAKAVKVAEMDFSRQTVNNRIHALGEIVPKFEGEKITAGHFELFVDEDHVLVRDGNGKTSSKIVPVAVVATGVDKSNSKRHTLENPLYLAEFPVSPDAFFNDLYAMMQLKYYYPATASITVHADGGQWIKHVEDVLPNTEFALDGFHLSKYKKAIKKYADKGTGQAIDNALKSGDLEKFKELCKRVKGTLESQEKEMFEENSNYFVNNWKAIQKRLSGAAVGSCTEAMVSHLTAERVSRTPGAWTQEGLSNMTMLRTLMANGEHVEPSNIRVHRDKDAEKERIDLRKRQGYNIYRELIEKERASIAKELKEIYREDRGTYWYDVASGTQILKKILSRVPTTT